MAIESVESPNQNQTRKHLHLTKEQHISGQLQTEEGQVDSEDILRLGNAERSVRQKLYEKEYNSDPDELEGARTHESVQYGRSCQHDRSQKQSVFCDEDKQFVLE